MPKTALKLIIAFIEGIPDRAFYRSRSKSWHKDKNMRFDTQGLTTAGPDQAYNIQVQVNRKHVDETLNTWSPNTVAKALIPVKGDMTPDQIWQALIDGIIAVLKEWVGVEPGGGGGKRGCQISARKVPASSVLPIPVCGLTDVF
ncbi:MAG: hypothetical protein M1826_004207 [Phylliscum demangeonii]|nr:MAG: hypothetical protein M1826_004207 [Phylliscum demangeonii]